MEEVQITILDKIQASILLYKKYIALALGLIFLMIFVTLGYRYYVKQSILKDSIAYSSLINNKPSKENELLISDLEKSKSNGYRILTTLYKLREAQSNDDEALEEEALLSLINNSATPYFYKDYGIYALSTLYINQKKLQEAEETIAKSDSRFKSKNKINIYSVLSNINKVYILTKSQKYDEAIEIIKSIKSNYIPNQYDSRNQIQDLLTNSMVFVLYEQQNNKNVSKNK